MYKILTLLESLFVKLNVQLTNQHEENKQRICLKLDFCLPFLIDQTEMEHGQLEREPRISLPGYRLFEANNLRSFRMGTVLGRLQRYCLFKHWTSIHGFMFNVFRTPNPWKCNPIISLTGINTGTISSVLLWENQNVLPCLPYSQSTVWK